MSDYYAKGEQHANSKLTNSVIKKLRKEKTYRGCINIWASQYDVSPTTISRVLSRKSWKHI